MKVALLSDVHSNLPALEAVSADIKQQQVDEVWFLGDAVGYYPHHKAVLARLRGLISPGAWVAGNHDWGVIGRIPAHYFSAQARPALLKTCAELASNDLAFLQSLPERVERQIDALQVTLIHASLDDPVGVNDGALKNPETAFRVDHLLTTPLCVIGHTHLRQVFVKDQPSSIGQMGWRMLEVNEASCAEGLVPLECAPTIINPGSVGQPRDGFGGLEQGYPHASYAILDTSNHTCVYRRVSYDIDLLQAHTRSWLADVMPEPQLAILVERLATNLG